MSATDGDATTLDAPPSPSSSIAEAKEAVLVSAYDAALVGIKAQMRLLLDYMTQPGTPLSQWLASTDAKPFECTPVVYMPQRIIKEGPDGKAEHDVVRRAVVTLANNTEECAAMLSALSGGLRFSASTTFIASKAMADLWPSNELQCHRVKRMASMGACELLSNMFTSSYDRQLFMDGGLVALSLQVKPMKRVGAAGV